MYVLVLCVCFNRRAGGQRRLDETEGYSVLGLWAVGCGQERRDENPSYFLIEVFILVVEQPTK